MSHSHSRTRCAAASAVSRSVSPRSAGAAPFLASLASVLGLVLAGCAGPSSGDAATGARQPESLGDSTAVATTSLPAPESPDDTAPSPDDRHSADGGDGAPPAGEFPVTIENCGFLVTVPAQPRRILAIKSTSLELLLALGLEEVVIGKAFLNGPVPDEWAAADAGIPLISEGAPAQEPVMALAPDMIMAGWESNFAADTAGERADLAAAGIATYVSPAACQGEHQPAKLTFDLLFDEFAQAGELLGVPDRAARLVEEQRAQLGGVIQALPDTTALWWSSAREVPFVGGGIGAPQMVLDEVGLVNIFADQPETWTSIGWESIVAADPDVIVVVDSPTNTAASKIAFLKEDPATAVLDAVRHNRFVTVPFPAAEAGVRSVDTALSVGAQLQELGLAQ